MTRASGTDGEVMEAADMEKVGGFGVVAADGVDTAEEAEDDTVGEYRGVDL